MFPDINYYFGDYDVVIADTNYGQTPKKISFKFQPSRLLTWAGSEGISGRGKAQHPTDHLAVHGVEAVVTHGAPDPVVFHLHSPSGSPRHKTHIHCGDTKLQLFKAPGGSNFGIVWIVWCTKYQANIGTGVQKVTEARVRGVKLIYNVDIQWLWLI